MKNTSIFLKNIPLILSVYASVVATVNSSFDFFNTIQGWFGHEGKILVSRVEIQDHSVLLKESSIFPSYSKNKNQDKGFEVPSINMDLIFENEGKDFVIFKNIRLCIIKGGGENCALYSTYYVDSNKYNPELKMNKIINFNSSVEESMKISFLSYEVEEIRGNKFLVAWEDSSGRTHKSNEYFVPKNANIFIQYTNSGS